MPRTRRMHDGYVNIIKTKGSDNCGMSFGPAHPFPAHVCPDVDPVSGRIPGCRRLQYHSTALLSLFHQRTLTTWTKGVSDNRQCI